MNISQHLALFVKNRLNCGTIFTLTGGGSMFLNDAFGNTKGLKCIYNHHEQAAAMAALGFSKIKGIGVCVTSTGCGATNAITGLLDAWQDNQPVLFISGQVKKRETTYFSGLPLRSFGVQELNIIPIVSSITKHAFCLGSKEEYFSCIERIPDLLFSGRPGPVWIDIPMDIQSQELSKAEASLSLALLSRVDIETNSLNPNPALLNDVIVALSIASKPIFLVGNGLRLSNFGNGITILQKFCLDNFIPVVSTYLGADFFNESFPNYLGVSGLKAARRANIALYNSDLIIAVGTRLATSVIGFEYELFAPNAKIFVVDIDPIEHFKTTRSSMTIVRSDAYAFIKELYLTAFTSVKSSNIDDWLNICIHMKGLLPVQEQFSPLEAVSIYDVVRSVCENCGDSDVLVSDAGSAYYVCSIMFSRKKQQRYVTSGAQADMGFAVPASIGIAASFDSSVARVHAVTGDGSFQLNLQEIQTIVTNQLPLTVYILNNNGYLSIRATQKSFFPGRQCGTDPSNGVNFPNIELLCSAYGIAYRFAANFRTVSDVVKESIHADYPIICEVLCPENEAITPRTKTVLRTDGVLESAPLCSMQPDLSLETTSALKSLGFVC